MTPVVASNANIRLRVMFALVAVWRTVVKVPAAMILLPTWTMAMTEPFITWGVNDAGLAETMAFWAVLTASAGEATRTPARARVVAPTPATRARRRRTRVRAARA